MTHPPTREQVNNSPYHPLVRRASAPAPQTQAYRESVGTTAATHREDVPYTTQETKPKRVGSSGGQAIRLDPRRQQPVAPADVEEEEYDDVWPTRMPSSTRRYVQPLSGARYQRHADQVIPRRRGQANRANPPDVVYAGAAAADQPTQAYHRRGFVRRVHPLVWLGVGMLCMLAAWVMWQSFSSWWVIHQDDATYGRPRTAQYDEVVGHNDSPNNPSHFIAVNLNGTAVVVEVPGGDTSKARIYKGPQIIAPNASLVPVTLTFSDVNHDGKLDMVLHIQAATIIYLNQNGQFVQQPAH